MSNYTALDFVETVLTFKPETKEQAVAIADFLDRRTRRNKDDAIEDSPEVPDIRATISLQTALPQNKFAIAQANMLNQEDAQLIVLRQKRNIGGRKWNHSQVELNSDLVGYLTLFDVPE